MELQQIIAMTKRLCEAPGTSGREDGAAAVAEELLAPLGTVTRNPLGSVLCCVNEGEPGAPHLMLEAHLDQIGMVVTRVEKDGFFAQLENGGNFPKKTFSVGEAKDKRYYLEGREISYE